ncbi:MAG: DNA translocase FtsK [bacterium]|nr:DNA translocase FtsK [bacterium]
MSKKKKNKNRRGNSPVPQIVVQSHDPKHHEHRLHPDVKKSVWAVALIGFAIIVVLAKLDAAGPVGGIIKQTLDTLLGFGYYIMPLALIIAAGVMLASERRKVVLATLTGASLLILSILGLIELIEIDKGGWLGKIFGALQYPFGQAAAIVLTIAGLVISVLVTLNVPLKLPSFKKEFDEDDGEEYDEAHDEEDEGEKSQEEKGGGKSDTKEDAVKISEASEKKFSLFPRKQKHAEPDKDYIPPPLSLLASNTERPTTGDLRGNANIIKRTLDSFGIAVEMGEISVGPKVTRYTLKPAEGMKLSRIEALHNDLALALAAHPIRIEAPIPGKSLVGIEVPNKAAALVHLGSLLGYPDFVSAGPLAFALGRDVTGEPIFGNIEKMPHLLIAGATGSGKSVMIHSLIISLLYKNSPKNLRMIMVDPKRVELTAYEHIPHLLGPVIVENKKAIGVFRWAISEMERRYEVLVGVGSRDIKSYNAKHPEDPLPYLVIIVDELADLMTAHGRDVEGAIVRLAQMARATGLHLVLSTQRPSVEVITGLIKANITSRVALQVASQVDSRTILDTGGAEKLLGGGDLLYVTSDLSKPKRLQGTYITEKEINAVADFVRDNNEPTVFSTENGPKLENVDTTSLEVFDEFAENGDDDELYEEAVKVVAAAGKASASLLQRRLKVGYARAARLLDIMEEKGVIGPGDGAKPRDVFVESQHDAQ